MLVVLLFYYYYNWIVTSLEWYTVHDIPKIYKLLIIEISNLFDILVRLPVIYILFFKL